MSNPAEATIYRCEQGWLALSYPAPDIYFSWASGIVRLPTVQRVLSDLDAHIARIPGTIDGFDDYRAVEDYHWDVRMYLFRWFMERRRRIGRMHVLATAPAIRVAAGVFKLALGGVLDITGDARVFEAKGNEVLARRGAARPRRPSIDEIPASLAPRSAAVHNR
jgi:hypothetical protein